MNTKYVQMNNLILGLLGLPYIIFSITLDTSIFNKIIIMVAGLILGVGYLLLGIVQWNVDPQDAAVLHRVLTNSRIYVWIWIIFSIGMDNISRQGMQSKAFVMYSTIGLIAIALLQFKFRDKVEVVVENNSKDLD